MKPDSDLERARVARNSESGRARVEVEMDLLMKRRGGLAPQSLPYGYDSAAGMPARDRQAQRREPVVDKHRRTNAGNDRTTVWPSPFANLRSGK